MWYEMLRTVVANLFGCFVGTGIAWFIVNKFTDWQFYQFAKRFKLIDLAHQKIQQELQKEVLSKKFEELIEKVKEAQAQEISKQTIN